LPEIFKCDLFLDADEIAAQLNPKNVEDVAMQAPRIMLEGIETNLSLKKTFEKFIGIVDRWYVYDNSKSPAEKIAEGEYSKRNKIINFEIWEKLKIIWNIL
jgi:predicted ABC-type ATPase